MSLNIQILLLAVVCGALLVEVVRLRIQVKWIRHKLRKHDEVETTVGTLATALFEVERCFGVVKHDPDVAVALRVLAGTLRRLRTDATHVSGSN